MSMILYRNNKWEDIWDKPKYQQARDLILKTFNDLVFDEGPHKYYLYGEELDCVSNVTHIFKPEFNSEDMAQATFERNFDNKESKYYRMTKEEILENWKKISNDACSIGSERHEFGESCFYYMTGQTDKILPAFKDRLREDGGFEALYPKEEAVVKFWQDLPECFVPILAENKVFNKNEHYNYAGTFDILFYYDATIEGKNDSGSGFCIFDYKTNKDLYKNFREQKLLYPFNELLDMSLNIYKLQLAAYQLCLEKLDFKVIARRLIWLRPNGDYQRIPLEDLSGLLNTALIKHFEK